MQAVSEMNSPPYLAEAEAPETSQSDAALEEARAAYRDHEAAKAGTVAAVDRVRAVDLRIREFNDRLREIALLSVSTRTEIYNALIVTGADASIGKQAARIDDLRRQAALLADAISILLSIEKPLAEFQQCEAAIRERQAEAALFRAAADFEGLKRGKILAAFGAQEGIIPRAALETGKTASLELRALELSSEAHEMQKALDQFRSRELPKMIAESMRLGFQFEDQPAPRI